MSRPDEKREVLAEFWMDESLRLWLNSISVLSSENDHRGGTYEILKGYDVDWSKRADSYLFHMSSGGGDFPVEVSGIYWRSDGFEVAEKPAQWCACGDGGEIDRAMTKYTRLRNQTRRLVKLPKVFAGYKNPFDWLESNGIHDEAVYCAECKDDIASEDLCEHCSWCSSVGWYVTPTEGEICLDADCYECRNIRKAKHEEYWRQNRRAAKTVSSDRPEQTSERGL